MTRTRASAAAAAAGRATLTRVEAFSVLLACLCHDLDHSGTTNGFEVASSSRLALRFNDASCLENHHCNRAFALASAARLFEHTPEADRREVRRLVIAAVLATDSAWFMFRSLSVYHDVSTDARSIACSQ